jgi:ATP-dependent protease ClpP protease subunit
MTDAQRALLEKHGLLILPDDITHETFALVVEATLICEGRPFTMHCHGEGGDSCAAGAIVDVITQHGQVTGLLAGDANSCHGVIFAACAKRYVYPGGRVGVHRVALESIGHVTADYAFSKARELEAHDWRNARILASACSDQTLYGDNFWYRMINDNSRGLHHLAAVKLIEYGFARPIRERSIEDKSA